jgi:hypothetical protein
MVRNVTRGTQRAKAALPDLPRAWNECVRQYRIARLGARIEDPERTGMS